MATELDPRACDRREALDLYTQTLWQVPGWLDAIDATLFRIIDELQGGLGLAGDILEIGTYQGRTAILLQYLCREHETLVVCDTFEDSTGNPETERERELFYEDLTRETFERTFRTHHQSLPDIHQCRSQELEHRLDGRSFRMVHVDGSHVHDVVRSDLRIAKAVTTAGGVVAIDDYRREHTPGVAAAAWDQVATQGLLPICLTPGKLYGCWTDADRYRDGLRTLTAADPALRTEEQAIFGRPVLRISDAAVEGASREEHLAVQLSQASAAHRADIEAWRFEREVRQEDVAAAQGELATTRHELATALGELAGVRADLHRDREELGRTSRALDETTRRLARTRRHVDEQTIELARRQLRNDDLGLRLRLIEAAFGVPGLVRGER